MTRRFLVASAIAVVVAAAFLPGSGFGSSATVVRGAQNIPAGLAEAIHVRLGAGTIRLGSAARRAGDPDLGLGVSLSADGTTALVGAPGVAGNKGAAYIFHASDAGSWSTRGTPVATLKHASGQGLFGGAVALSADGTTALVSAPLAGTGVFGAGAVYAFHVSAEDAWSSSTAATATLTVPHGQLDFLLGISLALSPDGTTLVVGAPFYNGFAGEAFVFHASSEGAWASTSTPTATLSNAVQSDKDGLAGSAVAISGDGTTALVGDSGNPNGGGAYLYHVLAEDAWATRSAPTAILSNAASGAKDALGGAVGLSGDGTVALLGAYGANSQRGAVDVFYSSGAWTSTSTPTAILTNAGGAADDQLGETLAVSTDGTTALLLASGVATGRGAAYIFHASGEAAWASSSAPTAKLTKAGAHAQDSLLIGALSTDGATALLGAPRVRSGTGAAYVFHASDASSWATSSTPNATLTNDALAACVVPKLKGLKLHAAKARLTVGRCRLGRVTRVHSTHRKGRILSQSRKPGRRLAIGAKIRVRVAK